MGVRRSGCSNVLAEKYYTSGCVAAEVHVVSRLGLVHACQMNTVRQPRHKCQHVTPWSHYSHSVGWVAHHGSRGAQCCLHEEGVDVSQSWQLSDEAVEVLRLCTQGEITGG